MVANLMNQAVRGLGMLEEKPRHVDKARKYRRVRQRLMENILATLVVLYIGIQHTKCDPDKH